MKKKEKLKSALGALASGFRLPQRHFSLDMRERKVLLSHCKLRVASETNKHSLISFCFFSRLSHRCLVREREVFRHCEVPFLVSRRHRRRRQQQITFH